MIIGIDPGAAGAIAVLSNDASKIIDIFDMPMLKEGSKNIVNSAFLHYTLKSYIEQSQSSNAVFIERVRPVANSGAQAGFAFGRNYQACITAATCLGLRVELVEPKAWKSEYKLKGGKEQKESSRAKAVQLYPSECHYFERKKDADRAEAVLIARYGAFRDKWEIAA